MKHGKALLSEEELDKVRKVSKKASETQQSLHRQEQNQTHMISINTYHLACAEGSALQYCSFCLEMSLIIQLALRVLHFSVVHFAWRCHLIIQLAPRVLHLSAVHFAWRCSRHHECCHSGYMGIQYLSSLILNSSLSTPGTLLLPCITCILNAKRRTKNGGDLGTRLPAYGSRHHLKVDFQ